MKNELDNLLNAIERADTFDLPYFHMHVENVFSDVFYKEIIENLPDESLFVQSSVGMGNKGKRHLFFIGEQFPDYPPPSFLPNVDFEVYCLFQ